MCLIVQYNVLFIKQMVFMCNFEYVINNLIDIFLLRFELSLYLIIANSYNLTTININYYEKDSTNIYDTYWSCKFKCANDDR